MTLSRAIALLESLVAHHGPHRHRYAIDAAHDALAIRQRASEERQRRAPDRPAGSLPYRDD